MLRDLSRKYTGSTFVSSNNLRTFQDRSDTIRGVAALLDGLAAENQHSKHLLIEALLPASCDDLSLTMDLRRAIYSVFAKQQGKSGHCLQSLADIREMC